MLHHVVVKATVPWRGRKLAPLGPRVPPRTAVRVLLHRQAIAAEGEQRTVDVEEEIAAALRDQVMDLDYIPNYQVAHPKAFEFANRLLNILPQGGQNDDHNNAFTNVFFANSGSEAVESALKIAMAYHYVKGDGRRTRLIGRVRGFHGSGFAGTGEKCFNRTSA